MDLNYIAEKLGERRVEDRLGIIGEENEYRKYAVIIPIVEKDGMLQVLFEVRSKSLKSQPGEISFPGGKIEKGEESLSAAVRETCEELGIGRTNIKVIGNTEVLVTQHNKIIYPYAAEITEIKRIIPSTDEVDHIFYVPLGFFMDNRPVVREIKIVTVPEEEFPYENMEKAAAYNWENGKSRVHFYRYNDYVIWGLTAKIMNNFIEKII